MRYLSQVYILACLLASFVGCTKTTTTIPAKVISSSQNDWESQQVAGRQQIIAVGRWGDSSKDCKIARALPLDRFSAPTRPNARAMAPAQKDRRSTASPARRFRP